MSDDVVMGIIPFLQERADVRINAIFKRFQILVSDSVKLDIDSHDV